MVELPTEGAQIFPTEILGGPYHCGNCKGELEFDDFPERYFMFFAAGD